MTDGKDVTIYDRDNPPDSKRPQNREPLELLQLVLLDDISLSVRKLEETQQKERIEGRLYENTLSATDSIQILNLIDQWPYKPLATVSFINSGPDDAVISVDEGSVWAPIANDGGSLNIDFMKADERVGLIYYKCENAGETASIGILGKF
jgi:hypothetical protein